VKRSFWLFAAIALWVSLALQVGGLTHEAVIDDHGWMHEPAQRGCSANVWECFQHPQLRYYFRPLVAVDFLLGKRWFHTPAGANEAYPFHVESLIQHGIVVLLVFWLFRLLFRRDLPALLAGVLFALHPLNVPVTTFIGGRTDNLALIFIALFAIGLLKAGKREEGTGEAEGRRQKAEEKSEEGEGKREEDAIQNPASSIQHPALVSLPWLLLSLLAFTAALFTKEQCVLLIVLAPLLMTMHSPEKMAWRRLWWQGMYAIPIGIYLWMAHRVGETMQLEDAAINGINGVHRSFFSSAAWSVGLYIEMIGRTCWYYGCAFVFPTVSRMHQSTLGPWDWAALGPLGRNVPLDVPTPPSVWLAVGGYAFLCFAVWLLWRTWHNRACRFCMLWLFLTVMPCLNIVPVPSQFVAPYRALIPLVGVCGLAGALLASLIEMGMPRDAGRASKGFRLPALPAFLLFVFSGCLIWGTLADVPQWKNDGTLMQAEIRADKNFVPAKTGEAFLYDQEGKNYDQEGKNEEAIASYNQAIASYDQALRQLLPEARTIDDVIRTGLAPDMPRRVASASSLRYNDVPYLASKITARGALKQRLGRWDGAAEDYRAALALNSKDNTMGDWLAYAYDHAGNLEAEEAALKAQIARRADAYRLAQLGSVYFRQRRWMLARDTLALALRAPASDIGSVIDITLVQQQYNEASVRALPAPSKRKSTTPR
jgi:hypothetical protein